MTQKQAKAIYLKECEKRYKDVIQEINNRIGNNAGTLSTAVTIAYRKTFRNAFTNYVDSNCDQLYKYTHFINTLGKYYVYKGFDVSIKKSNVSFDGSDSRFSDILEISWFIEK